MGISNHEQVGRALTFLRQGLYPYVERAMQAVHGDRWLTAATSSLPYDRGEEVMREDVSALLTVMSRQWDSVFKQKLSYVERALVSEIIEIRVVLHSHEN